MITISICMIYASLPLHIYVMQSMIRPCDMMTRCIITILPSLEGSCKLTPTVTGMPPLIMFKERRKHRDRGHHKRPGPNQHYRMPTQHHRNRQPERNRESGQGS